jgi:hypothetical protein
VQQLQAKLDPFRSDAEACQVICHLTLPDAETDLILGDSWRVSLHDDLLAALRAYLGDAAVTVLY